MDNKKITVILIILLTTLVILLFLKSCGVSTKNKQQQNRKDVKIETKADIPAVVNDVDAAVVEVTVSTIAVVEVKEETPPVEVVKQPEPKKKETVVIPDIKKETPKPVAPVVKQSISKEDLPKPATQRPRRDKVESPVFTNKSGFKPFYVYTDIGTKDNHYAPYGLMGDMSAISMDQGSQVRPYSGKTCIKIAYEPSKGNIGWAGIYWTEPANNWGDKGFGFNLTGAERVSFWARGEKGGEIINNFIVGGIRGKQHEDSDSRVIGPIELAQEWRQFYIELDDADLSNIIGGFCFTVTKESNSAGAVFYLDQILYE